MTRRVTSTLIACHVCTLFLGGCSDDNEASTSTAASSSTGDDSSGSGGTTGSTGSTGDLPPTSGSSESGESTAADTTGGSSALDGIWQTEGYGWVYEISGGDVRVFEVTQDTCVHVVVGTVLDDLGPQGNVRIDLEVPGLFTLGMSVLDAEADAKQFLSDGLVVAPPAHAVEALPSACLEKPAAEDLAVFDTLTAWFDEHYALFPDRDVDWDATVAEHRQQLAGANAPPLFEVVASMLQPLEDAHVSVQGADGVFEGRRTEAEPVTEEMVEQARTLISDAYLVTERQAWVDGQFEFAWLPGNVGYLATHGYGPLVGKDGRLDYLAGLDAVESALDEVFSGEPMTGLVLDLRTNGGGSDLYGLAIAERLAQESYVAYSIRARVDPTDPAVFGEAVDVTLAPSDRPGFDGSVAVLIGRDTVSAAEAGALALRGRQGITLYGEATQGAFSTVLNHFLPNGWLLGLPNEHYLTADGQRFDVVGIPPDVVTPVFSADDIAAGRDSALDAALADLGS